MTRCVKMQLVYDVNVFDVGAQAIGLIDGGAKKRGVRLEKRSSPEQSYHVLWISHIDFEYSLQKALNSKKLKSIALPREMFYGGKLSITVPEGVKIYICSQYSERQEYLEWVYAQLKEETRKKMQERYEDSIPTFVSPETRKFPEGWRDFFSSNTKIVSSIMEKIRDEKVYPPKDKLFECMRYFVPEETKVIIFGQDPYHSIEGQAMGLCFSVPKGFKPPPSLQNIFKELVNDGFSVEDETCGDLTKWAKQGVLLLNTALTVEPNKPLSHVKLWESFTTNLCEYINEKSRGCVVLCFGGKAKAFAGLFSKHHIISTAHPSPLSAHNGFFGSNVFSRCNSILRHMGIGEVDWNL